MWLKGRSVANMRRGVRGTPIALQKRSVSAVGSCRRQNQEARVCTSGQSRLMPSTNTSFQVPSFGDRQTQRPCQNIQLIHYHTSPLNYWSGLKPQNSTALASTTFRVVHSLCYTTISPRAGHRGVMTELSTCHTCSPSCRQPTLLPSPSPARHSPTATARAARAAAAARVGVGDLGSAVMRWGVGSLRRQP